MSSRTICVTTGNRAEYGLQYDLLKHLQDDSEIQFKLAVTGMHLSPEFGSTYHEIVEDGFTIDQKVEILLSSDTNTGMCKSIGLGCIEFADAFQQMDPDLLVVLGDRFEIFSAGIAAVSLNIPIAHIHGGEVSRGSVDDAFRHSLTKMASIHFPATKRAKERILQMGEPSSHVHHTGSPGLDELHRTNYISRERLLKKLDFDPDSKHGILLFHPTTRDPSNDRIDPVLNAIQNTDLQYVLIKTNADPSGRSFNRKLQSLAESSPEQYRIFNTLKRKTYLSALKHFDLLIGNSSSGITEAPSFQTPVVSIGARQKGRVKASNIIDCKNSRKDIEEAIKEVFSPSFQQQLDEVKNPYDKYEDGNTSERIKDVLKQTELDDSLLQKPFVEYK